MNIHPYPSPADNAPKTNTLRSSIEPKFEPVITLNCGDTVFVKPLNSIDDGIANYMINDISLSVNFDDNNMFSSNLKKNVSDENMKIVNYLNKETYYFYISLNKNYNYIIEYECDVESPLNTDVFEEELLKIFDANDFFVSKIKFITKVNNFMKKMFSNIPNKFETNKTNSIINIFNITKASINKDLIISYFDLYTDINIDFNVDIIIYINIIFVFKIIISGN